MAVKIIADAVSNLFDYIRKDKNLDIKIMSLHLTIGEHDYLCYEDKIDIKASEDVLYYIENNYNRDDIKTKYHGIKTITMQNKYNQKLGNHL